MNTDSGDPVLIEVRESHRFDVERLGAWLAERLDGFGGDLRVRQYEGGQSNPTFLVESAARQVVVRKKPPGVLLPTAHQVEREFRILAALVDSGVPVPDVIPAPRPGFPASRSSSTSIAAARASTRSRTGASISRSRSSASPPSFRGSIAADSKGMPRRGRRCRSASLCGCARRPGGDSGDDAISRVSWRV